MVTVQKLWPGSTVVCLGGGPSLTREDVDACSGRARVIAINNAYQLAPWADALYACDGAWWKWHAGVPSFTGLKYALTAIQGRWPGVQVLRPALGDGLSMDPRELRTGYSAVRHSNGSSGYQAINLAVHLGASRIVLLGYDMQRGPKGERHWHPDYPQQPLPSPLSGFAKAFPTLLEPLRAAGVTVVNCSRRTIVTCFPQMSLDEALVHEAVPA